jgi:predicted nucleic acid-binding protein
VSLVLDCSATLAWLLDDETTDAVRRVFDIVARNGAWVPSLWRLEVANSLQTAVRRRRITADNRDASLRNLGQHAITTDAETDAQAWTTTLQLADRFGLTLYDAAYLELAQRRHLPLATLDQSLRAAATAAGVSLLGIAE